MTRNLDVPDEYTALYRVFEDAYEQASEGKGKERHAEAGEPYERQIICEVTRRVGLGYPLGQAVKKIYESQRLIPQLGVQELLGAMNYLAAAVIVMQERMEEEGRRFREGFASSKAEGREGPEFKHGDRVQFRDEIPSTSEPHWFEGVYVERLSDGGHAVKFGPHDHVIHCSDKDIRRVPKAEGCEALVEKDAPLCGERCEEFIPGLGTCESCRHAREQDAPRTPDELCQHIVDCNPATFHTPSYAEELLEHHSRQQAHKPTSEELAEMAKEDAHE